MFFESTSQRVNESTSQRVNGSTSQRVNESTGQRVNESTSQRVNESTSQRVFFESTSQRVNECFLGQRVNEFFEIMVMGFVASPTGRDMPPACNACNKLKHCSLHIRCRGAILCARPTKSPPGWLIAFCSASCRFLFPFS